MRSPKAQAKSRPQFTYERRSAEDSLLRQVVAEQWPILLRQIREANDGQDLPKFVRKSVDNFLRCGVLRHGFSRLRCKTCKQEQLVAFSCKSRGICSSCDSKRMTELGAHIADSVIPQVPVRQFVLTVPAHLRTILAWNAELRRKVLAAYLRALHKHYIWQGVGQGAIEPQFAAISVMQRFNGALRIFTHWHVLVVDGVWSQTAQGLQFLAAPPLKPAQVVKLFADVIVRVTRQADRYFTKREADEDNPLQQPEPGMAALQRLSLFGAHEVERTPAKASGAGTAAFKHKGRNCLECAGFSLHCNTRIGAKAREALERLVRYLCRPAARVSRLQAVGEHQVRIILKSEWKGGVKAIVLSRHDLAARVVAQIPLARRPSVIYHGLFAPAAKQREEVVPARGGRCAHNKRKGKPTKVEGADPVDEFTYSTKLKWSACLRRTFFFDVMSCTCGGKRELIAVIQAEDQVERILKHVKLWRQDDDKDASEIIAIRGPPGSLLPEEALDEWPGDRWDGQDEQQPLDWVA